MRERIAELRKRLERLGKAFASFFPLVIVVAAFVPDWINRALPVDGLAGFVTSLAHRIARFPSAGQSLLKERVNAIALAPVDDFRRDSDLFGEGICSPEAQKQISAARKHGLQTRDAEMGLGAVLGDLDSR